MPETLPCNLELSRRRDRSRPHQIAVDWQRAYTPSRSCIAGAIGGTPGSSTPPERHAGAYNTTFVRGVSATISEAAGHARRSAANQLELIQCALRVGKGLLARAQVGNAISYTSPRYGRLKCLYLLRRYLAKFGLCCSD
jgi:hypothetical protein